MTADAIAFYSLWSIVCFVAGWYGGWRSAEWYISYPSVDEMIKRVKQAKFEEALKKAVDEKIDKDLG